MTPERDRSQPISRRALLVRLTALLLTALPPALSFHETARAAAPERNPLRPPAAPLVTHDPYFSIWSRADTLTDVGTTHWTGKPHRLRSLIRIDGKTFRLMGAEPADAPALPQTALQVFPTRTVYRFANETVRVTLTFLSPLLPDDLDLLARPVTYLTWDVQSADRRPRDVSLYLDAGSEIGMRTMRA